MSVVRKWDAELPGYPAPIASWPGTPRGMGKGTFERIFSNLEPASLLHPPVSLLCGGRQPGLCLHPCLHRGQQRATAPRSPGAPGLKQTGVAKQLIPFPLQPLLLWASPLKCSMPPRCRPPGSCHPSWGPRASNSFTTSCRPPMLRDPCSWLAVSSAPSSTQIWVRP